MARIESKNDLKFDESRIKHQFIQTSTFEIQYPRHRALYIKSVEEFAVKICDNKKILLEVDYDNSILKVSTTDKTRDPYMIIKAYELIQLISRGVTLEHASNILEDGYASELLPVKILCANEKVFERRKRRLENPKVLKSLELITKTHIVISTKTICIVGDYRGVYEAKNIVIKCFENIHPAFELKRLVAKKKLAKENCEGDWERLIPTIKKTHSKVKTEARKTGNMPQEIRERKEDMQMCTGEFFSKEENIAKLKLKEERRQKREQIRAEKQQKHVVPEE